MIVLVLTAVPVGLRGDLSRWLLEIAPGVFAGRVSRRVRERLWVRVRHGILKGGGSAVLVITAHDREQGYDILTAGVGRRIPADFDGITLMRMAPGMSGESGPPAGGQVNR
jgi:CRISPR-associated protein Cas2